MPWILLHQTWQIYPHQWSIDALNTYYQTGKLLADLPPSIEHRCLEYCYTKLGRSTPSQLSIDALNTTTPNLADLLADLTPISIEHRCLEYCYTKLGRSLAGIPPSIEHRCLEYCYTKLGRSNPQSIEHRCFEYCYQTWQIYWQIYPPSIEHRCLEYGYTKLGRSTPSQLSVDALNTATPNLADLLADLPPINQA